MIRRLRQLDRQIRRARLPSCAALVKETGTRLIRASGSVRCSLLASLARWPTRAATPVPTTSPRPTGTAPIPASSGRTERHRLNRGGNRRLNKALHYVALTQTIRPRAIAYLTRKQSEGKTRREALRCLKRLLPDVVYEHRSRRSGAVAARHRSSTASWSGSRRRS